MMHTESENPMRIMITLNGEPVGKGLLLDSVTYRPVGETENGSASEDVSSEL
ncbi:MULTISPECIES: hypothetical protein [Saccharibacillus]|uniref:hypothetical protein n=1 Tax=Saccharibacillus TaxID=456492 RepID=UPI0014785E49|nr:MULTISPECIES: hypothetical protein [Saccharibacillus]